MTSKVKKSAVGMVTHCNECSCSISRDPNAFTMEEKHRDVFKVELGCIAAKSSANVRLKYSTKLKMEGEELRFMLPWTVAPRFVLSKNKSVVTDFGSELFSKTHTQKESYELKVEAQVLMRFEIEDIRSPTHKISVFNCPFLVNNEYVNIKNVFRKAVTLTDTTATMDRDLLLYFKVEKHYEGSLVFEDGKQTVEQKKKGKPAKGSSALMLTILPKFEQQEHKAELVFVIDRSGSMNGAGIQQAKRVLLLFLHSLSVDCYVNVVGFGSTHHLLFPEGSRKYDDDVLKLGQDYAEAMEADLGESEIIEPLQAILKLPTIDGYLRQVFVITNAVVFNKDNVIPLVQQMTGKARVFTLGLGPNVCRVLVEEIARAGNGTALFTSLEEGLGGKVIHQLRDAFRPSWTNIKVEWNGFRENDLMQVTNKVTKPKLRQAPENGLIPPVFSGKHLIVYALLEDGAYIPQNATLTVQTPDKTDLKIEVQKHRMGITGRSLIRRMAAKELIQGLQHRSSEATKKQIIELASTYGLVSPFTNFVAVDPMVPGKTLEGSPIMMKFRAVSDCLSSANPTMSLESSSPMKLKGPVGEGKMMKVICLQHFNGSFQLDGTISKILDSSLDDIIEAGQEAKCPDELWPTLIAVSYLTLGLPQFRESWALVVEKANNWLDIFPFNKTLLKKKSDDFIKAKLKL